MGGSLGNTGWEGVRQAEEERVHAWKAGIPRSRAVTRRK